MTDRAVGQGALKQMCVGAAVLFTLAAAANMASPLYPSYQRMYDMPDPTMTALYAIFACTALPTLLFFGSSADAFGRRPALLLGIICAIIGTGLFTVDAIGVPGLFLGRIMHGVGLGLGTGAGIALMVEASPSRWPSLGSTAATIAFVLGTGTGPMVAGVIAEASHDVSTPFAVMLTALVATAIAVGMLRMHTPMTRQRWRPAWPSVPDRIRVSFGVAAATGFLGWAAIGVFLALLPSVAESLLSGSNTAVTGAVVGSVLLVSALSQTIAPTLETRAAQTIGLTLLGLGIALLLSSNIATLGESATLTMMTLAAIVTGAGHGLSYWGANREMDILTPPTQRAGVSAALHLAFYAGSGAPAIGVGMLTMGSSLVSAITMVSLVLLLCTIAFLPIPSLMLTPVRRPRPGRAAPHLTSGATSARPDDPGQESGPLIQQSEALTSDGMPT